MLRVLSALIGAVIGAGITYYVQTRTQKRAWKREYSIAIVEQVYGVICTEMKGIIMFLEKKYCVYRLGFDTWKQLQHDYKCFMVEESCRKRLDKFLENLERYSGAVVKLKIDNLASGTQSSTQISTQAVEGPSNLKLALVNQNSQEEQRRGSLAWLGRQTHNLENKWGKRPWSRGRGLESRPRH